MECRVVLGKYDATVCYFLVLWEIPYLRDFTGLFSSLIKKKKTSLLRSIAWENSRYYGTNTSDKLKIKPIESVSGFKREPLTFSLE